MRRILMSQYSGRAGHETHLCNPHAIGAISVPRVNRSRDYSWDQEAGHRHRARLCVKAGVGGRTEAPLVAARSASSANKLRGENRRALGVGPASARVDG